MFQEKAPGSGGLFGLRKKTEKRIKKSPSEPVGWDGDGKSCLFTANHQNFEVGHSSFCRCGVGVGWFEFPLAYRIDDIFVQVGNTAGYINHDISWPPVNSDCKVHGWYTDV